MKKLLTILLMLSSLTGFSQITMETKSVLTPVANEWQFVKLYTNYVTENVPVSEDSEVAVRITPEKYQFYVDGILTFETKEGLSDEPLYPILNNAVHGDNFDNTVDDLIVTSFKYVPLQKI